MVRTRVVNMRKEKYDYYIGRPSSLGNPYSHVSGTLAKFKVSSREESIERYREHFAQKVNEDSEFRKAVLNLKGKVLG